jgi:HK97 family phage major capsid protein
MQTYAEQRAGLDARRASTVARMAELNKESVGAGETMTAAQIEEFETLENDLEAIDGEIKRVAVMERLNAAEARPVEAKTAEEASKSRLPSVQVRAPAPVEKGILFTRYVMALANARGNLMQAAEIAKSNEKWMAQTPQIAEILKTAVAAGNTTDTTWASPLVQYQDMVEDFAEYLRPMTIIGKLNLRRVPFKTRIPRQTGASTVNWVGEGKVKPVSSLAFDNITLDHHKIAGIIVLTEELVRLSNPAAEQLVRADLAASIVQFMDSQFLDPTKASNDVSPASVTNGVTPVTATGATEAAFRTDVRTLMQSFAADNLSLADAVWIMTQQQAMAIGMMQTSLGTDSFPGIGVNGGNLFGLPVIVSENVPSTGGSPTDGYAVVLLKQSDILLADDGMVTIDASREASIQMETTPDSPATASTVLTSLWQHNMIGIRAERYATWKKRRDEAVGFIQNAKYGE